MTHKRLTHLFAATLISLPLVGSAVASPPIPPRHTEPYRLQTGSFNNVDGSPTLAFQTVIIAPNSPWMRIHFGEVKLGKSSWVELTSLWDDSWQRLDAASMATWGNASAFFNGDSVMLRLYAAPGDEDVLVSIEKLTIGDWIGDDGPQQLISLCGSDNRVASTDNRVGRLYGGGCTAWRITSGAFLTAGHCVDFDPDDTGPQVPNGVVDLNGVVEFNVPASLANGTPQWANADDQYPILLTNIYFRFDGEGLGLGKDWSIFDVGPNSNTGLMAHQAYGFPFRMTREAPAALNTIRITGMGADNTPTGTTGGNNAQHFTNQTSTGPYVGESSSGANIWHEYQTDTTGGNSGSPILWEANGLTIGIHTNGGCDTSGGGNSGTSFEVDQLETFLSTWVGTNARFVDVNHPLRVAESGTPYRPYSSVLLGITNVVSGGVVSIVQGNYTAAAGNTFLAGTGNKAMTLVAPCGTVTIGQ